MTHPDTPTMDELIEILLSGSMKELVDVCPNCQLKKGEREGEFYTMICYPAEGKNHLICSECRSRLPFMGPEEAARDIVHRIRHLQQENERLRQIMDDIINNKNVVYRHNTGVYEFWAKPVKLKVLTPPPKKESRMEWQPIETAPMYKKILFLMSDGEIEMGIIREVGTSGIEYVLYNHCKCCDDAMTTAPTNWMPLPAPPPSNTTKGEG